MPARFDAPVEAPPEAALIHVAGRLFCAGSAAAALLLRPPATG